MVVRHHIAFSGTDTEATEAYEKAAEMHEKVGADGDMATSLKEAGQMAIKGGAHEVGEKHLAGAAALYEEMNRISTAGKVRFSLDFVGCVVCRVATLCVCCAVVRLPPQAVCGGLHMHG